MSVEESTLRELLKAHERIHADWLVNRNTKLLEQHEQVSKLLESLGWKHTTPLAFEQKDKTGRIVFLGTRGFVEETDKYHKDYTCILYESDWNPFIIDVGETWQGRLEKKAIPILITHAHPDHLFGLKSTDLRDREIHLSDASLKSEYYKKEDYQIEPHVFKRDGVFVLAGRRVVSVPVLHSLKAPNVALFFNFCGKRICHATDVLSIYREDREEHLKGVDIYIGDGASLRNTLIRFKQEGGEKGKPYGHLSLLGQLRWARDVGVKCCIFTHWGSEAIKMDEDKLEEEVKKIANKIGYEGEVYIARDGAFLELPSMRWVLEKESVTEIADLKNYDPTKVRDDRVLGDDFRILLAWWANYYAPDAPKKGEPFKYSKELILEKAVELVKEMIRRGFTFNLPKEYTAGARDLFTKVIQAIGLDKFTWKGRGKIEYLEEVVKSLPGLYLVEPHAKMLWTGEKTLIVKSKRYTQYAGKLLYLLGDRVYGVGKHSQPDGPHLADKVRVELRDKHRISDEEWRKWFRDKSEVYLYTWTWIEKFEEPKDYVKLKGPQVYYKKVHLTEAVTEGKADTLIKKYVDSSRWEKMKVDSRVELMKKRQFLEPPYPFLPPKSTKGAYRELELFDKPSIVNLAKEWLEEFPGQFIFAETKFAGMGCMGMKKGDQIRMWSEGGERIDDVLPTLREELKKIRADSFILISELMAYDEKGMALPYRYVVKAMGKAEIEDSHWIAHVYDLGYLDGKDLHKTPYEERRRLLRGLELPRGDVPTRWNWHWVENIPLEARTVEQVVKAVKKCSRVKFSEGAMLKLSGGDISLTGRTPLVAKYKLFFDIDAMVVHLFPKRYTKGSKKGEPIPGQNNLGMVIGPVVPPADAKVYELGDLWKEDRSMDHWQDFKTHKIQYIKYKGKVYSNIGITFSTAEEVKVGDIVRVSVQLMRKVSSTEYHWTIPRVMEPRPEKTSPDPVEVADTIYKSMKHKLEMLLEKSIVEIDGEQYCDLEQFEGLLKEERLSLEKCKDLLEDNEIKEALVSEEDSYLTVPDEDKEWRYVVQCHVRGASAHL